jgi:hypothetical protein
MDIGSWLSPTGWYMLAGLFLASITAAYKFQYQALFYILVVCYGVYTLEGFFLVSLWHVVLVLITGVIRATKD